MRKGGSPNHGRLLLGLAGILIACGATAAFQEEPIPDLKPPRPTLPQEPPQSEIWPWVAGGAVILLAAAYALRPRKQAAPVEHPYERAARELRAMANTGPEAAAVLKVFQRYITAMLPTPGPGLTPDEICALLAQHPQWTPENSARFRRLFDPVELAKFAPVPPPPGDPVVAEALTMLNLVEDLRRSVASPTQPR